MKHKKLKSLHVKIIERLVVGWALPVIIMFFVMFAYVDRRERAEVESKGVLAFKNVIELVNMQIDECVTSSKNASYYSTIRDSYEQYLIDGRESVLANDVNTFLRQQYKYNMHFNAAIILFNNKELAPLHTYNNSNSATYKDIDLFMRDTMDRVLDMSYELGTETKIIASHDKLYMVRNLVLSNYEPFAILCLELNTESLFGGLESVYGFDNGCVFVDGITIYGEAADFDTVTLFKLLKKVEKNSQEFISEANADYAYLVSPVHKCNADLDYVVSLNKSDIFSRARTVWILFAAMIAFMIPVATGVFLFFKNKVTRPVEEMVKAFDRIRNEEYGSKIENISQNREFNYLEESFNHMSERLKYQFETIYQEELALRDAKIMALQSQINPHFLNNTLEIINWEARLNENYKVSSMIEALSTMLEATMNRKGTGFISLTEEMSYVDAYLYIIAQRLGDNFVFVKNIDDGLLSVQVPRLIIQPIVENAVEHGLGNKNKGKIEISIYKENDSIFIAVDNDSVLLNKDKERIERLLAEQGEAENESSLRLGIRNVNRRVKLIYGPDCGLSITGTEEGHTLSTIIIKADKQLQQYLTINDKADNLMK